MHTPTPVSIETPPPSTSLIAKLVNLYVYPGDVFAEVAVSPPRLMNWLVPTLLAALASLVLLNTATTPEHTAALIARMVDAGDVSAARTDVLSTNWKPISALGTGLGAFAGTFWSASLLWFIGRCFLQTRFSYMKAVEVVGLTGMILALGAIVTTLLIAASGDVAARPALSFFTRRLASGETAPAVLEALNFFHFWTTAVLAIGLARLSGTSFKQSAFWVFGYWIIARLTVILLA